jgi:hypothetical protein
MNLLSARNFRYLSSLFYGFGAASLVAAILLSTIIQPVQAQPPGECGVGYVFKKENPTNPYTYTAPIIISHLYIKSGSPQQGEACYLFTEDGSDGCYEVSGLGTNIVTVERIGSGQDCKQISHIEFYADDNPTPTQVTPTAITKTPTATPKTPTATQETPTATQVTPTATQETPTATQVTPTATQETPTATQVTPTATQETPTATQVTPTATQETPTATQGTPTATQETPTATQGTPTATQETTTPTFTPTQPEEFFTPTFTPTQPEETLTPTVTQTGVVSTATVTPPVEQTPTGTPVVEETPSGPTNTPPPGPTNTPPATLPPPPAATQTGGQNLLIPVAGGDMIVRPGLFSSAASELLMNLGIGFLGLGLVFHGMANQQARRKEDDNQVQ